MTGRCRGVVVRDMDAPRSTVTIGPYADYYNKEPRMSFAVDARAAEHLKCYVYAFRDRTQPGHPVIYIGRGGGSRVLDHLDGSHNPDLNARIDAMRSAGIQDRDMAEILLYGMDEASSQIAEAALIYLLRDSEHIVNQRMEHLPGLPGDNAVDLIQRLRGTPITIRETGIIVFVEEYWKPNMPRAVLERYARGYWFNIGQETQKTATVLIAAAQGTIRAAWRVVPGSWSTGILIPDRAERPDSLVNRWTCAVTDDPALEAAYIGRAAPTAVQLGWKKTPC